MKLNERLYDELGNLPYVEPALGEDYVPVPSTPIEVQQVNSHKVEIYYMNDYKDVLEEFTKQGKFAVWSSKDGVNYRLAVEKEYYEQLNELYSIPVNQEWLGFWDKCEVMQRNFSRKIILPVTAVLIVILIFFANWNNIFKNAQMNEGLNLGFTIGIPLVYLASMMFVRKKIINNITKEQQQALQNIKEHFGESKFEQLLKMQRTYIDEYFDAHYDNVDNKEEKSEIVEDNNQENKNEDSSEVIDEPKDEDKE